MSALFLIAFGAPSSATIAFVNATAASDNSGTNDATLALPALSVTTGNALVVATSAVANGGTWPPTSITDTAGNTFNLIVTGSWDASDNVSCYLALNVTGNASDVITTNFNGAWNFAAMVAAQYSGAATSSAVDTSFVGSNSGTQGTTHTTNAFTTTNANDALVVVDRILFNNNQTFTAGAGYTLEASDAAAQQIALEDKIVSATQSGVTASVTYSASVGWEMCGIALKQAAAGGNNNLMLLDVGR